MEFELTAAAETAADLGRLKALTANRDGKPRTQAVKVVWHDSPERNLAADGLVLLEQRGAWRLERLQPGAATWPPAQPSPTLAEAPDLSALPAPLAPVAAFEGRRTLSTHRFGDAAVTITIERGVLRSVTAERPVGRVRISGDEDAVRAAALLLAGSAPIAIPLYSLAAEGMSLASGQPAPARRHGAPVLPGDMTAVADALAHIIGHLTDVVLANAARAGQAGEAEIEAVHQMRVAVRRARSALAIFGSYVEASALAAITDDLRALGRQLGPTRDWDVFADETIPEVLKALPGDTRLERLSAAANRRRAEHRTALLKYLAGDAFTRLTINLAWFAAATAWRVTPEGEPPLLATFGADVLRHRWKKLLAQGKRMEEMDATALHKVRLRAKRARYAAEMFSTLFPPKASHRFVRRLSALQQRMGVLNDGAVATQLLEELGGASGRHAYAAGLVVGFLAARARKIRPRIERAFEKLRRQPAYWA
jgi:triphosphatase